MSAKGDEVTRGPHEIHLSHHSCARWRALGDSCLAAASANSLGSHRAYQYAITMDCRCSRNPLGGGSRLRVRPPGATVRANQSELSIGATTNVQRISCCRPRE